MISIIYGFIIAIFVILSGCFIRLGLILKELEKIKGTPEKRTCKTCIHFKTPVYEEPCESCFHESYTTLKYLPNWEYKQ